MFFFDDPRTGEVAVRLAYVDGGLTVAVSGYLEPCVDERFELHSDGRDSLFRSRAVPNPDPEDR